MSYDIYGERLARGHCEVHPWVNMEYPCPQCLLESEQHRQPSGPSGPPEPTLAEYIGFNEDAFIQTALAIYADCKAGKDNLDELMNKHLATIDDGFLHSLTQRLWITPDNPDGLRAVEVEG